MSTFGHTSEKRTRSQPWLLDIEDCMNSPSEDVAIEGLEESKKGRKMKKLHFRRFFRQTTTTRGGSTAGPPPEHPHSRRESPTPAMHMCDTGHTSIQPSTNPLTCPLTIIPSTSLFFSISFLSTHPFHVIPLGIPSATLEAHQTLPYHSQSVTHVQKNPR